MNFQHMLFRTPRHNKRILGKLFKRNHLKSGAKPLIAFLLDQQTPRKRPKTTPQIQSIPKPTRGLTNKNIPFPAEIDT